MSGHTICCVSEKGWIMDTTCQQLKKISKVYLLGIHKQYIYARNNLSQNNVMVGIT